MAKITENAPFQKWSILRKNRIFHQKNMGVIYDASVDKYMHSVDEMCVMGAIYVKLSSY